MKVTGDAELRAEPARVYAALTDPAVLRRTLPGCESVETRGADTYRLSVTGAVASVAGTYDGEVRVVDQEPPTSFVVTGGLGGSPGTVDGSVRVRLGGIDGGTRVEYDVDAVVGGKVGGVGQRMLAGAVRRTAADLLANVETELTAATTRPARAPEPRPVAAPVDVASPARERPSVFSHVAAALGGAAAALVGVALGRRRRGRG